MIGDGEHRPGTELAFSDGRSARLHCRLDGHRTTESSVWACSWYSGDGAVGERAVLRAYDLDSDRGDHFRWCFLDERAVLDSLHRERPAGTNDVLFPVAVPEVLHAEIFSNWAYLVLSQVPGTVTTDIPSGDMSIPDRLALVADLARALEVVHEHGYTHGDIHSANVLYLTDEQSRYASAGLVDFAAANHKDRHPDKLPVTNDECALPLQLDPAGPGSDAYSDTSTVARLATFLLIGKRFTDIELAQEDEWSVGGVPLVVPELWNLLARVGSDPEYLRRARVKHPAAWLSDSLGDLVRRVTALLSDPSRASAIRHEHGRLLLRERLVGNAHDAPSLAMMRDVVGALLASHDAEGVIFAADLADETACELGGKEWSALRHHTLAALAKTMAEAEHVLARARRLEPRDRRWLAHAAIEHEAAVRAELTGPFRMPADEATQALALLTSLPPQYTPVARTVASVTSRELPMAMSVLVPASGDGKVRGPGTALLLVLAIVVLMIVVMAALTAGR